jgi:hypothetical protein
MLRVTWQLTLTLLLTLTLTKVAWCIVEDSNDDLVIAIVVDQQDKYAVQDNYIEDGANFFMRWCSDNGGFKYPSLLFFYPYLFL